MQPKSQPTPSSNPLNRRTALAGAATAGAAAAAVALLPGAPTAPAAEAVSKAGKDADAAAGYRESEHVLHYYRTTRV